MTDNKQKTLRFLDLFAGAGGLSEGFIRAGFIPVAHVEVNKAACFTLKTRTAYHWLKKQGQLQFYDDYLHGNITRADLYNLIPNKDISSVINSEIGEDTIVGPIVKTRNLKI
jgi:DNA (cytosine-5)-methyltransferase 1